MTSASKRKGNSFERETVNAARERGLPARRAYASDGRSLGYSETVDTVVCGITIQNKRRKKIAAFLMPPDGVDMVLFRPDRGEAMCLISYDKFLDLLEDLHNAKTALKMLAEGAQPSSAVRAEDSDSSSATHSLDPNQHRLRF
jgi:hypothetical protein